MLAAKMERTKIDKAKNKFQTSLEYLVEYQGVTEAVIFDNEGLVVGCLGRDGLDAEVLSPLALLMLDQISYVLKRLDESPAQSMVIKNKDCWITVERIDSVVLLVKAVIKTDELLKVRISQAVDMIRSYMNENYPQLIK
jgi:predicted regulator of Ras-like GTPase activity (Roadblock/LC7/MglB family)